MNLLSNVTNLGRLLCRMKVCITFIFPQALILSRSLLTFQYLWSSCSVQSLVVATGRMVFCWYKQRRQSRSSRPGDHWANALTEIASPIFCMQVRSLHIVCTDPFSHERHGLDIKESCGGLRPSRFECDGHTFSAGIAWNMIRSTTKQNSEWLVCIALSCVSTEAWNCRWTLFSLCADVKWIRILL